MPVRDRSVKRTDAPISVDVLILPNAMVAARPQEEPPTSLCRCATRPGRPRLLATRTSPGGSACTAGIDRCDRTRAPSVVRRRGHRRRRARHRRQGHGLRALARAGRAGRSRVACRRARCRGRHEPPLGSRRRFQGRHQRLYSVRFERPWHTQPSPVVQLDLEPVVHDRGQRPHLDQRGHDRT